MVRKIKRSHYEEIKTLDLYKKNLGHGFHLCTIYGVAGNKNMPWWKRFLSHIYMICRFEILDD